MVPGGAVMVVIAMMTIGDDDIHTEQQNTISAYLQ